MNNTETVLLLHALNSDLERISGVSDVELMFPNYDSSRNYIIHNAHRPIPAVLKKYKFDAIIMTSTFMDLVKGFKTNSYWFRQYDFLKFSKCIKLVYSQDDYWLSEHRDFFYTNFNISIVNPSTEPSSWQDLLPSFHNRGIIRQGYASYITPHIKSLTKYSRDWEQRENCVFYRATGTPTFPNELGYVKAALGDTFISQMRKHNLNFSYDISTSRGSFLVGEEWYKKLGDSKCVLGSNSGSSINIKNIFIANKLKKQLSRDSNIDKLLTHIPKVDQKKNYTGISPRNIEAGFTKTLQLLVPGSYSGILKPYIDYVPLSDDCSNIQEVFEIIKNKEKCLEIIDSCYNTLLNYKPLDIMHEIHFFEDLLTKQKKTLQNNNNSISYSNLSYQYQKSISSVPAVNIYQKLYRKIYDSFI